MDQIDQFVRQGFAKQVAIDEQRLFADDFTLAQVIAGSENLHNSVDLMEVFARLAVSVQRNYGVKIRLPAFPLDTTVSEVLAAFSAQVAEKRATETAQPPA